MIKSITVTNYLGESLTIELGRPDLSGFLVQSIDGLGPSKADINSTELSSIDGAIFNSSRVLSRNIVLVLALLPKPTIEDTRHLSYKYFPIKKRVVLRIETDNRISEAYGWVESNVPSIFAKKQVAQISIVCPDPYLYSVESSITLFSGVTPLFEFPFENDSLVTKTLEIGELVNLTVGNIYYEGDAEVGIILTIKANGEATNVAIQNVHTGEVMTIDTTRLATLTGFGIIAGDEITICTITGNKSVVLLRDGTYVNILNSLTFESDWLKLTRGDNIFAYTADTGITNLQFRIENQVVYEGA